MASCYNIEGVEIECSHGACIGSDCWEGTFTGGSTSGGVNMGSNYNNYGLEGLAGMTQEDFQEWFLDYQDWGETFEGLTNPGAEDPTLISESEALIMSQYFQGYNEWFEGWLNTESAENALQMNELFDLWNDSTDVLIAEQNQRSLDIKDKNKELFMMQEKFQDQINSWDNRNQILEQVKNIRAIQGGMTKEGLQSKREMELYEGAIEDTLSDWYRNQNFQDKKLTNKLSLLDERLRGENEKRMLDKHRESLIKDARMDESISQMELSNLKRIVNLRDEYEGEVYDMLADLASSGAFYATPDAIIPSNFGCNQYDNNGQCISWDVTDAMADNESDGGGGGDVCQYNCADGCNYLVDCNGMPSGSYYTSANCCDGSDNDSGGGGCDPSYNLLGQCVSCCP